MYDMQPPQPIQIPQRQPENNKRLSVPQIMLIVVVIAFAIGYLFVTLTPKSSPYATISAGQIGARYTGDCLIVREEMPYDAEGVARVTYVAEEGTRINRGSVICNVYMSGYSTRETDTLQEYRDLIKEYQIKLLRSEVATDTRMEKLEADVLTRAREVRALVGGARGNMGNQESLLAAAIKSRQSYLKEKYAEDQRLARLYDDELSQLQRISSWTKQFVASEDGLISFYSDGYEYGLTINNFDSFSPSQVRDMMNGQKPQASVDALKGKTTIYRSVREGRYVVLMLIRDSKWNPVEGAMYELKLENFKDTNVRAQVLSFTRMGGDLLVRLDVQDDVKAVLYIRTCTGVLGDSVTSLTVPARAIYNQDNMPGVVVVDGDYRCFIPVNVLDKQGDIVFISPIQQGVLYEGLTVMLF